MQLIMNVFDSLCVCVDIILKKEDLPSKLTYEFQKNCLKSPRNTQLLGLNYLQTL